LQCITLYTLYAKYSKLYYVTKGYRASELPGQSRAKLHAKQLYPKSLTFVQSSVCLLKTLESVALILYTNKGLPSQLKISAYMSWLEASNLGEDVQASPELKKPFSGVYFR